MVSCKIELANSHSAIYFAGELLKGTIELHLNEPKQFRGLRFFVYGAAQCQWTESKEETTGTGENRRTETKTIYFDGKEVYLNQRTYLFGGESASPITVPSGTHRYNFECLLPPQLPASFEGSLGNIRYNLEAVLDIPWNFNKEFKLQFTVLRKDDLNLQPHLRIPSQSEEMKRFCCLFCESEPLLMTVTIPYTGFSPGQSIPITIKYDNKSNVEIEASKICLKRTIQYHSQTPHNATNSITEKLIKMNVDGCAGSSSLKIEKDLEIPRTFACSNSQFCGIVQIHYYLEVEAVVRGCHSNLDFAIPITLGSIPINFDPAFQPSAPPDSSFVKNGSSIPIFDPSQAPAFAPASAPMSEQPPPSFDEALRMDNPSAVTASNNIPRLGFGWNVPPSTEPSAPK